MSQENTETADKSLLDSIDFDQELTEEEEQEAIIKAARILAPKYIVVENQLAVKFPDGEKLLIELDIPYYKLEEIMSSRDSATGEELDAPKQFEMILNYLGLGEQMEKIKSKGSLAITSLAEKYFQTYTRIQRASMGKFGS